jgi:putative AdoMet-dependent methyltransferase
MLAIAKQKLRGRTVRFVLADILEFFDIQQGQFDYVVSSYAIHHLTDGEKDHLFSCVRAAISPGGKAVFVDLMYRNLADRNRLMDQFRQTDPDVVEGFQEEFFWNLDLALDQLKHHGFDSTQKRFSDLSWGLLAIPVAGEEARGK